MTRRISQHERKRSTEVNVNWRWLGGRIKKKVDPVGDPDLELRGGGGGLDLLALSAIFPSVISSFFLPKLMGGPGPPGPSPRFATGIQARTSIR